MKNTIGLATCGVAIVAIAVTAQVKFPLPEPGKGTPNFGSVVPRPEGAQPKVPAGFTVSIFADDLAGARTMEYAPNGDLFVAQSFQNTISVLRDTNKDGVPDTRAVYAQGPPPPARRGGGPPAITPGAACVAEGATGGRQPFGMAFQNGYLYVGYTDCIVRYKYTAGDTKPQGAPEKLAELPTGGGHVTRNILFRRDGKKMYVAVGSASNNDDGEDPRRAAINEYNADGTGHRIFASGIRNPVGLALQPGTDIVWTAVNERDNLGDDLVPDYATSVKDGGFYGWPYSYIGQNYDPKHQGKMPELVKRTIVPDVLIQAHSAALGITFYTAQQFPQRYRNGAFVALHGSWNRSKTSGVKVIFIPFQGGKPGAVEDFMTGFVVSETDNSKWGRPVGVTVAPDGSLLVSDDGGNRIWRVRYM